MMNQFHHKEDFLLEGGGTLPGFTLGYHTWGSMNEQGDNVIWICHALTASSDVQAWWPDLIGQGRTFDTKKYFIICVNILGSCYGSTGPLSVDPRTGLPFYSSFPFVTIRDMVRAYQVFALHIGVQKIHLLAGGSMGGYQALEWAVMNPGFIRQLYLIATAARESSWRIAIHTAQRMSIEADSSFGQADNRAGEAGLKAARAIGMLTYRNPHIYEEKQQDEDPHKMDDFKVSSYIRYQGEKLAARFNAYSYWFLTKAMDTHNLARDRNNSIKEILNSINQRTLVMGIQTDILCPLQEQEFLAEQMPSAELIVIDSDYGHDGFLTERREIALHLGRWLEQKLVHND